MAIMKILILTDPIDKKGEHLTGTDREENA